MMTKKEIADLAEEIFEIDKQRRIGLLDGQSSEISSFFVKDDAIYIVPVPPWYEEWNPSLQRKEDKSFAQKRVHSLWMRLIARALDAEVHLLSSEAYVLRRCGYCGYDIRGENEDHNINNLYCPECGTKHGSVLPSQSPYAEEQINVYAEMKKNPGQGFFWAANIIRDKDGRVLDYETILSGKETEIAGQFSNPWKLLPGMEFPFALNYPLICEVFGKKCSQEEKGAAKIVKNLNIPGMIDFNEGLVTLINDKLNIVHSAGEIRNIIAKNIASSN